LSFPGNSVSAEVGTVVASSATVVTVALTGVASSVDIGTTGVLVQVSAGGISASGIAGMVAIPGDYSAQLDQILAILTGRKVYDSTTKLWRVYDSTGVELADPSGILLRGLHGWLLMQANQQYYAQEEAQSGVRRLMYYQLQEQALLKRDAERQDAVAAPQTPQAAKKRTAKSRRIVKATPRGVVVPMDPAWYNAPAPQSHLCP
jgi:hypothetical protein